MENLLKKHLYSEEWLRDLFDQAHDLIQIVHIDGTLVYVNKSWSIMLEYRQDEIQGKSIYDFIHESDKYRYRQYRQQIINGHKPVPIIFDLVTKSGNNIKVEGIVTVKKEDDNPLYTRGIFRDITQRVKNEEALKKLNEQLQERQNNLEQLLKHAPDAVIVIDIEGRITFWNPKAEKVFGWRAEEVMGETLSSTIIPPQYREAHNDGMKRFLATGEAHVLNKTIDISAINKKGEEFYVSLTISQAIQENKVAFIAFLRDISEQKKNQLALEEKTKQLKLSNESLEAFAYAASHDLKEPIRKVQIFSDRLKNKWQVKLDEEDKSFFERIENATSRMRMLIDDLLSYAAASSDNMILEEVNLVDIIQEVLEDLELSVQEKNATITIESLPTVKGHRRQLQQAFQNMIDNSLKYSKPHVPPVIRLRTRIVNADEIQNIDLSKSLDKFHLIELEDNGVGFDQKEAEKIFKVFTRLHSHAVQKGTGVGLAIVQKVIDNHNGHIWAESEIGKGTVFNVLLPAS